MACTLLELDLSNNRLSARVAAALAALADLRRLSLAHNPLRDFCKHDDIYVTGTYLYYTIPSPYVPTYIHYE